MEFLLERTSESDDDVIDEDQEIETGITITSPTRKLSTGSNTGPRRMRRRSRRRRKTCIPELNLSEGCKSKDDVQSSSPSLLRKQTFMRRCFSFDRFTRSSSMFEMKRQSSLMSSKNSVFDVQSGRTSKSSLCRSSSSKLSESDERYRARFSGSEERFRSPVKRRISLKEYHIVKKDACFYASLDENQFNTSF